MFWQTYKGGSVILETAAPPEAVICAPFLIDNRYGEDEYIVDRRHLGTVRVVARFPQKSFEEFR